MNDMESKLDKIGIDIVEDMKTGDSKKLRQDLKDAMEIMREEALDQGDIDKASLMAMAAYATDMFSDDMLYDYIELAFVHGFKLE